MLSSRTKVSSYRSPILEPEEYADRFSSTVTNGFIALEIAIGHKLGLFGSLNEFTSPVSPTELAVSCKLKERYVREWLGCMSAAGYVSISSDDKYFIPEACKPHTESSKLASALLQLAANTSSVLECFKEDGPKGYDYSNQFDTLMWLDHDNQSCDSKWIKENLFPVGYKEPDTITNVLDFGCGPGSLTIKLAEYLPNAKVYGVDIDRNSIEKAKENKAKENIPNVEFVLLENDHMDESWTNKFDWITLVDVLHDLPNPNFSISDIRRVLKDDGIVSVIDPCVHSDHKMNQGNQTAAMLYVFSTFLCLPCSMSREPAVGNGVGWGVENRAEFLKSNDLKILGDEHNGLVQFQKA
ncbi:S-adenosylmethionine-dependent methyltransferase Rv2258c-like isoform X1 [Mytilus edulis]|uniref:S-adenosylmethionine-dependent methyltransferase Rv2258c-like isoform X1 n=1 Tax=Mytilus edulis TaxID=6550 RepID=UPI0039F0338E